MISQQTFDASRTQRGDDLLTLSRRSPLLVVFLRHSGCPFCREALAELSVKRAAIAELGVEIVLVHMMNDADAAALFKRYGMDGVDRVSDPERRLYGAFGLESGTASQVIGPRIWWRGFKATLLRGHLPGWPKGDVFQLPGAFLFSNGEIRRAFRPADSAVQPDWQGLASATEGTECPKNTCDISPELPATDTSAQSGGVR